jgi:hypothetical protein
VGVNSVRAYLDSCITIYLVEEHLLYAPKLESHLAKHPDVTVCFSALSEMECLVMPMRNLDILST